MLVKHACVDVRTENQQTCLNFVTKSQIYIVNLKILLIQFLLLQFKISIVVNAVLINYYLTFWKRHEIQCGLFDCIADRLFTEYRKSGAHLGLK